MRRLLLILLVVWLAAPRLATCQTSDDQLEQSFRAGQEAMRRGDFAHAADEFKKVLALDPTLIEAEVNLGLAYQSLAEYDLAVRHLTKALRERPNLLGPTVIVGMDYLKLGSPQKAIPFLQRALKLDPSNHDAHEALASSYLGEENFRSAGEEFRQIALLDTDKPEAWFKLGHEYLDLAARLAYRGAHLYRDSAWGHHFLGDLLFQRELWDDASHEYRKALGIDPQQPGLHNALGQTALHNGKLEEAEKEFRQELQLDSRSERAWIGLANLQLAQGQATQALESVSKVWEISPEFLAVQREFLSIELPQDAGKTSIARVQDTPEKPAKHFLLAALYSATNETSRSEREWKSFQVDFSTWQRTAKSASAVQAGQDACKAHRSKSISPPGKGRRKLPAHRQRVRMLAKRIVTLGASLRCKQERI